MLEDLPTDIWSYIVGKIDKYDMVEKVITSTDYEDISSLKKIQGLVSRQLVIVNKKKFERLNLKDGDKIMVKLTWAENYNPYTFKKYLKHRILLESFRFNEVSMSQHQYETVEDIKIMDEQEYIKHIDKLKTQYKLGEASFQTMLQQLFYPQF